MDTDNTSYEEHTLKSYIDPETGHIVKQDEFKVVKRNQKEKGYKLVYLSNLKEYLAYLSVKEIYALLDILDTEVSTNFELQTTYKRLSDSFDMSEISAKRFLGKLKKNSIIRGNMGAYKVNPFIVIPYRTSDYIVAEAQREWGTL